MSLYPQRSFVVDAPTPRAATANRSHCSLRHGANERGYTFREHVRSRARMGILALVGLSFAAAKTLTSVAQTVTTGVQRDDTALATVRRGIESMGGYSRWQQTQAIQVRGEVSVNGGSPQQLTWSDDWSNGLKAHRTVLSPAGTIRADGTSSSTSAGNDSGKRSRFLPKFDRFNALLIHAPAAAMDLAYSGNTYTIRPAAYVQKGKDCVEILLNTKPLQEGGVNAQLCFSSDTGLLAEAQTAISSGPNGEQVVIEKLTYETFGQREGLVFPAKVTLSLPGLRQQYTFAAAGQAQASTDMGRAQ